MKKRILSGLCIISTVMMMFGTSLINAQAADAGLVQVDGSFLTNEEYSEGTTEHITRGEHMMDGICSITKAGKGRIYVYASTTANHDVDYLSTVLYVDRYNEETGKWGQIDFWQVEDFDTYYVATSKTLKVDSGYYYRVHADHVAGMKDAPPYDEATSFTDGIFVN